MSRTHRIVWTEGMFLGPHHFQQWDHHVQAELAYRHAVGQAHAWGVRTLQLEREALANGRVQLSALEAVLPDGVGIQAPARDPLPASRAVEGHFPAEQARLEVYLALPEARAGIPLCRLDGGEGTTESRYVGETVRVADDNRSGNEIELTAARANLKLLFADESLDGHTVLKLAEIERAADGKLAPAADYAPPALTLAAAGPAAEIVRSIVEVLSAKSTALAEQTRQRGGGLVEYGTSDVGNFWLLHTVNSYLPLLAHDLRTPATHPAQVYLHLAQLVGALCTFGVGRHPRDIAPYTHEAAGPVFRALERDVRELLQTVMPSRYASVPLERRDESTLVGSFPSAELLEPGVEWYLAVSGELPEERVRADVPVRVIVGSPHNLDFLVRTATPGVKLSHIAVPPRDFPLKSGHTYFRIDAKGETWDTIREARALALFTGGPELRSLTFELITTTR
jgi:type VI secretion system protein ImpJ